VRHGRPRNKGAARDEELEESKLPVVERLWGHIQDVDDRAVGEVLGVLAGVRCVPGGLPAWSALADASGTAATASAEKRSA
jgi:hypothetical protein